MNSLKKKHYALILLAVLLLGVAAYAWHLYSRISSPLLNGTTTHYLYIDNDDTPDSVYAKLAPVSHQPALDGLKWLTAHYDYNLRTGRYALEPGTKSLDVFRQLRNGQQAPVMLTVPDVRTMERMAARLSSKLMIDSSEIAQALTSQEYCQQLGYDTATIACMFVPNTYEVYWNTSLDALMQRMQREHDAYWNAQRQQQAQAQGLTPNEVATLASIIDEETSNNAEKPMIAGMYLNRLKQNMPLQADPTIKFAWKNFGLKRIYNNLLHIHSPYNTYVNPGLPPGPIRVASIAGIDAVLNMVHHNYLYMCAKEDFSGTHNFAATYEEHMANARRYAAALNKRGIK